MIGRRRPWNEDCWKQNVSERKRNKVRILVHASKPFFDCDFYECIRRKLILEELPNSSETEDMRKVR